MTLTPRSIPLFATLAAAALLLSGCTPSSPDIEPGEVIIGEEECQRNADVGTITYISGYGYSASAGQMDVFLAEEMGLFDALCLDVEINASGANGQQLVSAGQAQFTALGSASDVLLAAANSDNLTAIATYGSVPPFSIFAHPDVEDLTDLEGRRLGYFINLTPIASAMLDNAGVDIDEVELVQMTNYDPTVVTRGQIDAIVGYASNQPQTLRAMGEEFTEFFPADYGVEGTYNVMEVNTRFLEEHRDVVADFMRATLRALERCLDDHDLCIDLLSELAEESGQGVAFPRDQLERTWAVESAWVTSNPALPPGVQTLDQWRGEYELVERYGGLREMPTLDRVMEVDLVADLYDESGSLIWPGE